MVLTPDVAGYHVFLGVFMFHRGTLEGIHT
jgi:hypothetical protein